MMSLYVIGTGGILRVNFCQIFDLCKALPHPKKIRMIKPCTGCVIAPRSIKPPLTTQKVIGFSVQVR